MPGSIFIELILWLFFLVPGLLYSVWRHSASKQVCKVCGSLDVIPANSPVAKKALGIVDEPQISTEPEFDVMGRPFASKK